MEVITETTPQAVRDKIADWLEWHSTQRGHLGHGLREMAQQLRNIPCVGEIIGDALPDGAKIDHAELLPDGSGFATASMPLPEDHWLYGSSQRPPMSFRMGKTDPRRAEFEERLRQAGRYAVKAATMSGKDDDFDPDALIQNLIVGALGYHTSNGLTQMGPEDSKLFDPQPLPPYFHSIDLLPNYEPKQAEVFRKAEDDYLSDYQGG